MKVILGLALLALACSASTPIQSSQLALQVPGGARIEVQGGQTLIVQLLVVGANGAQVAITSPNLPAFARIDADRLQLAPTRSDAGNYPFTLVATAGHQTVTADVQLTVDVPNTPPRVSTWYWEDGQALKAGTGLSRPLQFFGEPTLTIFPCDDEHDAMTFEVEVVPAGRPFTGVATYSANASTTDPTSTACFVGPVPSLTFSGLQQGTSYDVAFRLRDGVGLAWVAPPFTTDMGNGWARWNFGLYVGTGACPLPGCLCTASKVPCSYAGSDCCSGVCSAGLCQ